MRRIHLFEIEDQAWCPELIRVCLTEFLATVARLTKITAPTIEVIRQTLGRTSHKNLIVLGAGSGGGVLDVARELSQSIKIILTDLYPPADFQTALPNVTYWKEPVNAAMVPGELKGVRVMYNSFHHLTPVLARQTLKNAADEGQPLLIFESTERSIKGLIACLFIPLLVLIFTPMVRPFRWSRLLLTYAIPILPLVIFFDGVVSSLRTYSIEEITEMTKDLSSHHWDIQFLAGPRGERIFSLTGIPRRS